MKKIICTVSNDLTYDQRMIRICTSLSRAGYEVLLVGRKRGNSSPLHPRSFQQKRLSCYFNKGKLFYLEYNIRLFVFLLFTRFDAVNSIDLDTLLAGFFTAKIKGKTCIYDAHEYFTEVPELVGRPKVQQIWKAIERFVVPKLSYCYTVGASLADLFTKEYGTKFALVRNVPFRLSFFDQPQTTFKKGKKILLYQGALNEGRGLEYLIDAMHGIENAELQLAGEGDLSDELRERVKSQGLQNKVKFLGFIKPDELKKITQKADLGLNLLENRGLSYYYSLANKAFDYIQARKPSINMNFPEYAKLNEEFSTFHLVNNLQSKTLQEAINRLFNDEKYYDSIVENCNKAAEILVWENEEKVLLDLYKKALD